MTQFAGIILKSQSCWWEVGSRQRQQFCR